MLDVQVNPTCVQGSSLVDKRAMRDLRLDSFMRPYGTDELFGSPPSHWNREDTWVWLLAYLRLAILHEVYPTSGRWNCDVPLKA